MEFQSGETVYLHSGEVIGNLSNLSISANGLTATVSNYRRNKNMMTEDYSNSVCKCERCGEFYTEKDILEFRKKDNGDGSMFFVNAKLGDGQGIHRMGLCPDCLKALAEFMKPNCTTKNPDLGDMSTADIQRMAIQMMVDKAWEELKKTSEDD